MKYIVDSKQLDELTKECRVGILRTKMSDLNKSAQKYKEPDYEGEVVLRTVYGNVLVCVPNKFAGKWVNIQLRILEGKE